MSFPGVMAEDVECGTGTSIVVRHCQAVNILASQVNAVYREAFREAQDAIMAVMAPISNVDPSQKRRKKRDTTYLGATFCTHAENLEANKGDGGIAGWLGKIFSSVTNTPTYSDIRTIARHMCELGKVGDLVSKDIANTAEKLTSIQTTTDKSFQEINEGMTNQRARIFEVQHKLGNLSMAVLSSTENLVERLAQVEEGTEYVIRLYADLYKAEERMRQSLEKAGDFVRGVSTLHGGYLPRELVPLEETSKVLANVRHYVTDNGLNLRLVHPNPIFYYHVQGSVVYAREDTILFLTLKIQLGTEGGLMAVYRVDQTHLSVTPKSPASTRVENLPDFFAVTQNHRYFVEMSTAHFLTCPGDGGTVRTCRTERALQDANRKTCAAAIFFNDARAVLLKCDIRVETSPVPSRAVRLEDNRYLVHTEDFYNTSWTERCEGDRIKRIPACNTCVLNVPCGCSVDAEDFFIPTQVTNCRVMGDLPTVNVSYPVNLHVMSHVFDINEVIKIDGDTVFSGEDAGAHLTLPNLDFNLTISSDWGHVVEKEKLYAASLDKLMVHYNNRSQLFKSQADYFLHKAEDFSKDNLGKLSSLGKLFDGGALANLLNPSSSLAFTSVFWIIAVLAFALSVFNCCKRR